MFDENSPSGSQHLKYLERLERENKQYAEYWEYLKEKVLKGYDWRRSYVHKEIYNKLAYLKGYLHKLEFVRRNISIESIENYIGLLHVLGFSQKRIYVAVQDLIEEHKIPTVVTLRGISAYLGSDEGWKWTRERQEFERGFREERMKIFAGLYEELFSVEKEILQAKLEKVKELKEEFKNINPSDDPAAFKRVSRQMNELMDDVKNAHGVNDMRKTAVIIAGEAAKIALAKKIEKDMDEGKTAPESFANIMEVEEAFALGSGE